MGRYSAIEVRNIYVHIYIFNVAAGVLHDRNIKCFYNYFMQPFYVYMYMYVAIVIN